MLITRGEVSSPPTDIVHDGANARHVAAEPARERPRIRLRRQAAIIAAAASAYFLVRIVTEGAYGTALHNANRVIDLEKALGIYHESALQSAASSWPGVTTAVNLVYVWGLWPVVAVTLLWLARRHPETFLRARNALLASGAVGLVVFASFPLAPPRLAGLGLVDTVAVGSNASWLLQPTGFTNQYAAMPSLHVGWNLLMGLAIATAARRLVVRAIGVVMPVAMVASVVLTANHYIVDAVVGAALTATCWVACGYWQRRRRTAPPPLAAVPAPVPLPTRLEEPVGAAR